jgi:hypothetical protein
MFLPPTAPANHGRAAKLRLLQVSGLGSERTATERQLETHGIMLPLAQSAEWLRLRGYRSSTLFTAVDSKELPHAAAAIAIEPSRSLPGHRIFRLERLSATASAGADDELLAGIVEAARSDRRCIRAQIGLFEREPQSRQRLAQTLKRLGFTRSARSESYIRTPCLDLALSEDELFAKCAASARRNVRAPSKRGFELMALNHASYARRLEDLLDEAYGRTGGTRSGLPWAGILELSRAMPDRSRVVGLRAPDEKSPGGILSFAWGCMNGNYATYEAGASTRNHRWGNLALAYAPLWDLIAWAKRSGAMWFDLGGVTAKASGVDDPLGGISDFKRFFCDEIVDVGEQWVFEPRRIRAMIARTLSAAARHSRRTFSRHARLSSSRT